jgi:hypothetical protein
LFDLSFKILLGSVADTAIYVQLTDEPLRLPVDAFALAASQKGGLTGELANAFKQDAGEFWQRVKGRIEEESKGRQMYAPDMPILIEIPEEFKEKGFTSYLFLATAFDPKPDYIHAATAAVREENHDHKYKNSNIQC